MARRTQQWTSDLHPQYQFDQEWDDEDGGHFVCIRVNGPEGFFTALKPDPGAPTAVYDPTRVTDLHDYCLGINKHKNAVVRPAIIDALPDTHKLLVEDGHYEPKHPLDFTVGQGGELIVTTGAPEPYIKVLVQAEASKRKFAKA
jgi:hypothetical protein